MIMRGAMMCLGAALLVFTASVRAEDKEEPSTYFEIGGAGEWGLKHGESSFGPNVAVEYTAIEHWLELEAGFSPLFRSGQAELDTDLVFKKPFQLSETLEVMIGGGPEWVYTTSGKPANSLAAEAVVDFIYSPWGERNTGFYLEPGYAYDLGKGHEQSLGVSAGLHIPIQ